MSRLDEIAARAEAATKGPWEKCLGSGNNLMTGIHSYARCHDTQPNPDFICDLAPDSQYEGSVLERHGVQEHVANLNFIAAAREDIPFLLALVASQSASLERVRDLCDKTTDSFTSPVLGEYEWDKEHIGVYVTDLLTALGDEAVPHE